MKKIICRSLKFLILLHLFTVSAEAQNFNSEVEASIRINDSKDNLLEITGISKNLTEATYSLHYELSIITSSGNNNSSKNSQTGRFPLEPFETRELSSTTVSINSKQRTIVLLMIYDEDDEVMGTSRMVFDEKTQKKEEKQFSYENKNEGIELTSMVIQSTKTKPGKDFYDFFYQQYSLNPVKGNKMIKIEEMISFGRTTKVMVKVDDRVVYEFFARPKLDYLKEQAISALKQVNRYMEYLKNRSEKISQY
ncbi:curli-like amyloid fiber formation chaperone CsgH [Salegentibacter holothuriorum]|uniref:curli-like amyloid fiber formation chaperone CsgH n=1 Tax=Salegentibacter holothuriorum TaxID=241145 RepID=UPI0015927FA7|nr:curli-like amyloid fiber formation chaperone CsgH [Salegentibacter holothuriorum]